MLARFNAYSAPERAAFNEGFAAASEGAKPATEGLFPGKPAEAEAWLLGFENFRKQRETRKPKPQVLNFTTMDSRLAFLLENSLEVLADFIRIPLAEWFLRGTDVTTKLVNSLSWDDAEVVEGAYLGPDAPAHREGCWHTWIVTKDGTVVDLLAWTFSKKNKAEVRVLLPNSLESATLAPYYDEGAESSWNIRRGKFPSKEAHEVVHAVEDEELRGKLLVSVALQDLARFQAGEGLAPEGFTTRQLRWLCERPCSEWETKTAQKLYAFADARGFGAFVPEHFRVRTRRRAKWKFDT